MSFSSGVFSINTAGQPVVTGTVISSTAFNALTADLATGLSTCMLKDGTQTMTANVPMNSFKFTGLAAGTTAGDSVRYEQLTTPTNATKQATTSGTGVTFSGIPSWAKNIAILLNGVSTDTSKPLLRLGDAGGIESTGYLGSSFQLSSTAVSAGIASTTDFPVASIFSGTGVYQGTILLTMLDSATFMWDCFGMISNTGTNELHLVAGRKATSAALDRVAVLVDSGAFDAGEVNILYW